MRLTLKLHPEFRCDAVERIDVELARQGGRLQLAYIVTGDIAGLSLPAPAAPVRADGLWQHSCFENFVRVGDEAGYAEFNFAPSGEWAAYRFSGHRSGMAKLPIATPRIETQAFPGRYELHAALDSQITSATRWRIGLSAVIEETDGRKSYWALAHPSGQADFHHEDCFALELPPAA
jgi:hypothetical protein